MIAPVAAATEQRHGQNQALLQAVADRPAATAFVAAWRGATRTVNWAAYAALVAQAMRGLATGARLRNAQVVAIDGPSGLLWWLAHDAISLSGGVVVGLDPSWSKDQRADVLARSRAAVIVHLDETAAALHVCTVPDEGAGTVALDLGAAASSDEVWATLTAVDLDPDAPATIIFTSGTTAAIGQLKGFEYTHRQVVASTETLQGELPELLGATRAVSWLPLASTTQRILNFVAIRLGCTIHFVSGPGELVANLPHISPGYLFSIPRLYEKLYFVIVTGLARSRRTDERLLARALTAIVALASGRRRTPWLARLLAGFVRRLGAATSARVSVRHFGHDLRLLLAGGAPTSLWLQLVYRALGVQMLEGYGLTECAILLAMNTTRHQRLGSVGRPCPGNQVRIGGDDEVLVHSIGVARPLDGPRLQDADGYLHTNDLGRLDRDGFLFLTGRKNDIFKTSNGRRIAPTPIESRLCESGLFERAVVFGESRQSLGAIVTLDGDRARALGGDDLTWLRTIVEGELERVNRGVAAYQTVRGAIVAVGGFSVAGGELTSTQKIRRAAVLRKFEREIDLLYGELEAAGRDDRIRLLFVNQPGH